MIPRRRLLALLLLLPALAHAQARSRTRRIGVMLITRTGDAEVERVLLEQLAAAGFDEGRNLRVQRESIEFDGTQAAAAARRLVRSDPEVVFAVSEPIVDALRAESSAVPIVFVHVTDPVERDYVKSYSRPGGNITGVSDQYVESGLKRLELLRECFPGARHVGFVAHFDDRLGVDTWAAAAVKLGFRVTEIDLRPRGASMIDAALEEGRRAGVDCLFPIGSLHGLAKPPGESPVAAFQRFALRHRLPAVFSSNSVVRERAGLMSLQADYAHAHRRAAAMVARILRGERPATMPVEQADRFTLAVNLATARAMGVEIPQSVLLRAEEVIR